MRTPPLCIRMKGWPVSCFLGFHEQQWPSSSKRFSGAAVSAGEAPRTSAETCGRDRSLARERENLRRSRHAHAHEESACRRAQGLGVEAARNGQLIVRASAMQSTLFRRPAITNKPTPAKISIQVDGSGTTTIWPTKLSWIDPRFEVPLAFVLVGASKRLFEYMPGACELSKVTSGSSDPPGIILKTDRSRSSRNWTPR